MSSALALAAGAPAFAQDGNTLGPPQLRDYQLPGERRTPPPRPQQVQPTAPAPAAPAPAAQPGPRQPERAQPARQRPGATDRSRLPEARNPAPAIPSQPQDVFQLPEAPAAPVPTSSNETAPAPAPDANERPFWHYLLGGGLLLAGMALVALRRRRRPIAAPVTAAEDVPFPAPRPLPVARPWIEIEVKAERAASTDSEASVDFELLLHNTGKSSARNIRLNARMFNAGREQDKEIGAFFRTKGEGRKTHTIGDLPPGERGLIQGSVTMAREDMRALQVNEQLLFIPVLGVNVVYDWGEGRTGQTSKSYVIGRELGEQSDKMGAFRLDLGPRIYRTVGQRQHSLAKRV